MGTGADSYVVGKGIRSAGGIIIQVNDNQFHIDPGPGALQAAGLVGISLRANTAVLASNTDLYNCNDINAVIDTMTYSGFDKKGVLVTSKKIISGSEKEHPFLLNEQKNFLERFIVMQPGQRVAINDIEIQALKTIAGDIDSLGFKFYTPSFTLSYTSDTKYSVEIAEQYKDSGILILKIKNPEKDTKGLSREDAVKIIKKVNPRLAVITGFGKRMLESDPLYVAREIQKQTGIQTIAAKDGMVLSPVSYSAQQGQRTFGTFSRQKKVEITKEPESAKTEKPEAKETQKTITEAQGVAPSDSQ